MRSLVMMGESKRAVHTDRAEQTPAMPLGRVDRDAPWLGVPQRFGELGVVEDAEAERSGASRAAGPSVRRPQRERGGGRVGREHRGAIGGDDGGHGDRDLVGHLGHLARRGKRARQLEQLDEVLALLAHLVQRGRRIEGGRRMTGVDREHAALVGEEPVRLGIARREASVSPARRHHVDDEQPRVVLGGRAAGERRHEQRDLGVGQPDVVDAQRIDVVRAHREHELRCVRSDRGAVR